MLGPLEQYMTPTLDAALLISSWAGADLGRTSDRLNDGVGKSRLKVVIIGHRVTD